MLASPTSLRWDEDDEGGRGGNLDEGVGVLSGDDARAKIEAGADLVQVYTGLIYKGPGLVADCAKALARR